MQVENIYSHNLTQVLYQQFADEVKRLERTFYPSVLDIGQRSESFRISHEKEDFCYRVICGSNKGNRKSKRNRKGKCNRNGCSYAIENNLEKLKS
jgi:hypothetical protein